IAKLCARLDGLPLALALAAACLRSHSPDSLVTMLENHAALPARAMEDAPARQGSLERAVEWSY
ncbi:hypothetical protein, partial [Deinococcus pimensis]|uniref:hypothetical protein n=1 Tax=Deinococcus pimensis TaxID=309888 RepID=UPI0005EB9CF5